MEISKRSEDATKKHVVTTQVIQKRLVGNEKKLQTTGSSLANKWHCGEHITQRDSQKWCGLEMLKLSVEIPTLSVDYADYAGEVWNLTRLQG